MSDLSSKQRLRLVPQPQASFADSVGDPADPEDNAAPKVGAKPAPSPQMSQLLELARGGDMQAWAKLYLQEFDGLARHISYLVGDISVTEDLVQETFAQALVHLGEFSGQSSFGAWLRGIARNLVRKHWRSRSRGHAAHDRLQMTIENSSVVERGNPESRLQRERRADQLAAALAELPEHLREAFILRDVEGLSVPECAECLEVTPGNLRVRAARARAKIHEYFSARGWVEVDTPVRERARSQEGEGPK